MKTSDWLRGRGGVVVLIAGAAIIAVAAWDSHARSSAAEDKSNLATFMRKELAASSQILEGLTVEDPALIKQGSATILEMSKSELWNVFLDEDYREFNREFRSAMRKLEQAATDENYDNALLQWNAALKGCMECHKYVRDERAAKKGQ